MFKSNEYYVPNNVLGHREDPVGNKTDRLSPRGASILEGSAVGCKRNTAVVTWKTLTHREGGGGRH